LALINCKVRGNDAGSSAAEPAAFATWAPGKIRPATGGKAVNVEELEVPPQVTVLDGVHPVGVGLTTVTSTLVGEAMSDAEMGVVSPKMVAKVVVRGPFHCTVEQGTNPVPTTEREKPGLPAGKLDGFSCVIAGTGKDVTGLIVKGSEFDVDPELDTLTFTVPSVAMSA
jgi:hypothetical protein